MDVAKRIRIDGHNWKNWLQVNRSRFPAAGRGLFASEDIPAKTVLGKYHGPRITTLREVYALKDDRYVSAISLPNGRQLWVDGNARSNYLRFVNGAKTRVEQKFVNVEAYQYGEVLKFRATRPILAGEELILDYSEEYWETYSTTKGIKHRNDDLLHQIEKELEHCNDTRARAALRGMMWLINQMSSVSAYYSFFLEYLWMFYEFRSSKSNPVVVDVATKVLRLELDGAQFRLNKMFKPNLGDKWRFLRFIPMLSAAQVHTKEYAEFYRSYFPRSLKYYDVSFNDCLKLGDFEATVDVLTDYCLLELARRSNQDSRSFRLPKSRFSEFWRGIKQTDISALEASVTNDDMQFDLDYQVTHLVMCRFGYGTRVLAPASKFDRQITDYLVRHEKRILEDSGDLDLVAVLAYCYLELNTRKRWVQKAINKILASQNANGSWGGKDQMQLKMYDRLHATWTAVSALCHSLSK
jgi:hypothetical protein